MEESETLLYGDEKREIQRSSWVSRYRWIFLILSHSLVAITAFFVARHTLPRSSRPYSVNGLNEVVHHYETSKFTAFQNSPYIGKPSQSIDDAWAELMAPMTIRASADELTRGNQTSVELPDGGHMTWPGVYHELHCIVRVPLLFVLTCTDWTELHSGMGVSRSLSPQSDRARVPTSFDS